MVLKITTCVLKITTCVLKKTWRQVDLDENCFMMVVLCWIGLGVATKSSGSEQERFPTLECLEITLFAKTVN